MVDRRPVSRELDLLRSRQSVSRQLSAFAMSPLSSSRYFESAIVSRNLARVSVDAHVVGSQGLAI